MTTGTAYSRTSAQLVPFALHRINYNRIISGEFGEVVKTRTQQDIRDGKTIVVERI